MDIHTRCVCVSSRAVVFENAQRYNYDLHNIFIKRWQAGLVHKYVTPQQLLSCCHVLLCSINHNHVVITFPTQSCQDTIIICTTSSSKDDRWNPFHEYLFPCFVNMICIIWICNLNLNFHLQLSFAQHLPQNKCFTSSKGSMNMSPPCFENITQPAFSKFDGGLDPKAYDENISLFPS